MTEKNVDYTLGFLFYECYCVLIKKNRPDWQQGQLNGIGGKVKKDELVIDAMVREFNEEAGIPLCRLQGVQWDAVTMMKLMSTDSRVHVYGGHWTWGSSFFDVVDPFVDNNDEGIPTIVNTNKLPDNVLPNLHWLLPMARRPRDAPELISFI